MMAQSIIVYPMDMKIPDRSQTKYLLAGDLSYGQAGIINC